MAKQQFLEVGGQRIRVTNLDKVLYPSTGTTKGHVIAYYSAIAATMLPHCEDRPATRKRWPDGVGEEGEGSFFFQKDLGDGAPDWLTTGDIQHKNHVNTYPLVNDEATLVWLAQLASLEIHVPQWRFDANGKPNNPDRMVFDLDPGEGVTVRDCARVAFLVRDILKDMGLTTVPVTSGSKGVHLYAALDGSWTSDQVSKVAKQLARSLEADYPDEITSTMKRALRAGKVFIDWSQNNASKTTVAPYSLRGRVRPTVAAPRTWRELASPHLRQLEFHEVLKRVAKRGDPLAELARTAAHSTHEKLSEYRAKRDAKRTPEPVPSGMDDDDAEDDRAGDLSDDPVFVIQRHEARRLHYDFRLERDGVLVSWALPKGVPTDTNKNHLAVPTEDHPMSYRHFEGTIPKGEYGAGEVQIWDEGHYVAEKWTNNKVVAALRGTKPNGIGGERRYALFRAGDDNGKPRWMIHLMGSEPEPATPPTEFLPMLATAGNEHELARLDPDEWAFEMKWDGIRAIASVAKGGTTLRTRSGSDVTSAYPELSSLTEVVHAEDAVLDGEIVALGPDGIPSFSRLQQRFGLTESREIARVQKNAPATLFLFDVLSINGQDCRGLAYRQRRELLTELIDENASGVPVAVPVVFEGDADEAVEASEMLSLEGIVAKRWNSRYESGARSEAWVKFPLIHTDEAVVIGWRESEADANGFASLLLAIPGNGGWRYAGRVGTGFSSSERRTIRQRLEPLQQQKPAGTVPGEVARDAHWVEPALVAEVTSKGRTATGSFRQPVWRGWRPDKAPKDL